MVSKDFGKLEARRHFTDGRDWAIAGMATVVATVVPAAPTAAAFRNSRRFIAVSSPVVRCFRPLAAGLARARKLASFAPGDHHLPVIPGLAEGESPEPMTTDGANRTTASGSCGKIGVYGFR